MEEDAEAETRFEPASRRKCEVKPEQHRGGGGQRSRELDATHIM